MQKCQAKSIFLSLVGGDTSVNSWHAFAALTLGLVVVDGVLLLLFLDGVILSIPGVVYRTQSLG